jgi:phytoene dehydrogenase-like protein
MTNNENYDIIVIGAGIGGLIAACQLGQANKRVLLVENLSFLGGRFSAFDFNGSQIPSGAFHTFPHGDNGPLAQALSRSGVEVEVPSSEIFASFHVGGQNIIVQNGFGILKVVPTISEKISLVRALFHSWFKLHYPGSFGEWLIETGISERGRAIYDRFCQFALSTSVYDVSYEEGRKVTGMIIKFGLPGVPLGGAQRITKQLGLVAEKAGVVIRKSSQVQKLFVEQGKVTGVLVHDRRNKRDYEAYASVVISNIGPQNTIDMAKESGIVGTDKSVSLPDAPLPAVGLKIQVLSPHSLVDHDSIMFCLDTKRVAGILQASNVDPSLAPPGKHLLISHQTIPHGSDWREELKLGLADWEYLFGEKFADCEVLGASHFPDRFPVNWATQGYDLREQIFAGRGLWMVGDGVKPQGLIMAEGVAGSAEQVVNMILGNKNTTPWNVPQTKIWPRRIPYFQKKP